MKMNNEEQIFFDDENITVTNARVICGGETYVINNITSVKTLVEDPNRLGWIILLLSGLFISAYFEFIIFGLLIAIVAAFVLYRQKPTYHLILTTSAGQARALLTTQRHYIDEITAAINQAIVYRSQ